MTQYDTKILETCLSSFLDDSCISPANISSTHEVSTLLSRHTQQSLIEGSSKGPANRECYGNTGVIGWIINPPNDARLLGETHWKWAFIVVFFDPLWLWYDNRHCIPKVHESSRHDEYIVHNPLVLWMIEIDKCVVTPDEFGHMRHPCSHARHMQTSCLQTCTIKANGTTAELVQFQCSPSAQSSICKWVYWLKLSGATTNFMNICPFHSLPKDPCPWSWIADRLESSHFANFDWTRGQRSTIEGL